MSAVLSVLGFAALFALFGLFRSRRGCGSNCGACSGGACQRMEADDEQA